MPADENPPIEIDFTRKETEAGWIRILDSTGKNAAPTWFNWLGWTLIIAAFQYLFDKSKSFLVAVVLIISVAFLGLHMQAFFFRLRFKNFPVVRRWDQSHVPSILVGGLLALVSWYGALWIARTIAQNQP